MYKEFYQQAKDLANEMIDKAKLSQGDLVVVGCSSSEIEGKMIGKGSDVDAAAAVFDGLYEVFSSHGIDLAAQCCEHLNRALIVEKRVQQQRGLEEVNVVPMPKAGGSFATTAYTRFDRPAAVEHIRAEAGIDIGDTLIGMHLKDVAVPLRTEIRQIGQAHVVCARTRPKFIGGQRAHYDETKM